MGQLWEIVQAYRARFEPHPPSIRRIALQISMSPTALGNWDKPLSRLPERRNLLALADLSGVPYVRVVDAALADANYLPEAQARAVDDLAKQEERAYREQLWLAARELLFQADFDEAAAEAAARSKLFKGSSDNAFWTDVASLLRRELKMPPWIVALALAEPTDESVAEANEYLARSVDGESYTAIEFIKKNMSEGRGTTDASVPLAADDDAEPIERGQGHDENA